MSAHLYVAAAYLDLTAHPATTKLVLMAIADSADEHTLEAAPGLPKLRAWSGLGKSQTLATVTLLTELGLVERIGRGHTGRRAVYRVFPAGVPAIPHPTEVAARYTPGSGGPDPLAPSPPVDDPESVHRTGSGEPDPPAERGSDFGPTGSGAPDPFSPTLQSSSAPPPSSTAQPVGTPTPPARRPQASGFPGARRPVDDRPTPTPDHPRCPDHPRHLLLDCPECARRHSPPPPGWRKLAEKGTP